MKSVLALMISLVMITSLFIGGLQIASAMMAEPEPHRFAHLDTPDLWTLQPKTIDAAAQTYERLPAATPPVSEPVRQAKADTSQGRRYQPANTRNELDHSIETASIGNEPMAPEYIAAHLDWCHQRYRSYDEADNSYQPYGGDRRECVSPYSTREIGVIDSMPPEDAFAQAQPMQAEPMQDEMAQQQAINDASAMSQEHVEWCFAQYRSYRPEDNTYQPYGGPRQECYSPHG